VGSLVQGIVLPDQDEQARALLADLFKAWQGLIAAGLERMQAKGTLKPDADPEQLAAGLMAALQGGYLLANTAHDVRPMEIAMARRGGCCGRRVSSDTIL
jgi:hypothetical protein